jgi:hypothetical protein
MYAPPPPHLGLEHLGQLAVQRDKALRQIALCLARGRMADTVGDMGNPRAGHVNDAPTKVPKPRVDSQDTHARPRLLFFSD